MRTVKPLVASLVRRLHKVAERSYTSNGAHDKAHATRIDTKPDMFSTILLQPSQLSLHARTHVVILTETTAMFGCVYILLFPMEQQEFQIYAFLARKSPS